MECGMTLLRWLRRASWEPAVDAVSSSWLQEHAQKARVEFEGVAWRFPVDKAGNEQPAKGRG
jgi:hypothetical protein